jgi:CDP-4-dehydro-6-deoxyglucose reductase
MEHAMALEQAESIHLYWIAPNEDNLYLPGLARAWADALDDFHYEPIVVGRALDTTDARQETAIRQVIAPKLAALPSLARSDIYVAGLDQGVASVERMLQSLGVPQAQIHIDYET